jgi:hypothetical protein
MNKSDAQLDRQALEYARELHATANDLRRGAEHWRLPPETSEEYAERRGAREWVVHAASDYALPQAKLVVELAARLDVIADEIRV